MSNTIEYKDIMAFHPGYYVADIIEDQNMSQLEFATRMGTTPKTLSQLVNGQINISNDLAKKLSAMLGTSVEVWLNLQEDFDEKLIEIEKEKDLDSQVEIVSMIDYSYFESVCGLEKTKDKKEQASNLCKYFMISDLKIMTQPGFLMHSKNSEKKNLINSRAWLQTAINFSKNIEAKPYNAAKLKGYLPELREMALKSSTDFLPRLREIFSECGVAFILLTQLRNSEIDGAVKWINGEKVMLAINNRELNTDRFWFLLFHEIKHVLQRKLKTVFIHSATGDIEERNKGLEEEADAFAKNLLFSEIKIG